MTAELDRLRGEIDRIDGEILERLNQRAQFARAIGTLKVGQAYRPEREAQVLRRIKENNPGPLGDETVAYIFREIMSACLALERPITVAYLGPQGTFSESAAMKHFGLAAVTMPMPSIDEVYRAVESGAADFGVVPVENSTEGAVGRSLDLMPQTPAKACGEVLIRIHHHLLSRDAAASPSAIKRIYSHSQSLAQCHEWLNNNAPNAERMAVASNAEAARRAFEEPGTAAVAGDRAAEYYKLAILAANIEDEPNNTTRFLIIGDYEPKRSGRDRTSLVLSARNRAGAVYEMLTPFATRGVSMTRFESRPSKVALWEYLFFVDIEGHRDDANVAAALEEVGRIAGYLKVLGSYPVAVL
ncbi:MAG TPA: prephenate dehydratase [Usitatibacteraceae bacterium]|nr:prephenate dehydratase [Usitatibacteraceae bacterium]